MLYSFLGRRASRSNGGIVIGMFLLIVAFPLLWWNEGRSLHRLQTLREGRGSVVSVASDTILPTNNGKLIFVSGKATTEGILSDDVFGVRENALALSRKVEMYQWEETEQPESGGSRTQKAFSYRKIWSDQPIPSSKFNMPLEHENPGMPYRSQTFMAHDVKVGAFALTDDYTSEISGYTYYPLTEQNSSALSERLEGAFKLSNGEYINDDPSNPKVGAIRVSYTVLRPTDVSIVGQQTGASIRPYEMDSGDIQLVRNGIVSAESMFADAEDSNTVVTWVARLGGFLLMWAGLRMIVARFVLSSVAPFLGDIVRAGSVLIAGLGAVVLFLITVAAAWIFYRPWVGGGLLAAAILAQLGAVDLIRTMKAKMAPLFGRAQRPARGPQ